MDIFCLHIFLIFLELPYRSYDIWQELINKPSIISYFPSTFCPAVGHHWELGGGCITKLM